MNSPHYSSIGKSFSALLIGTLLVTAPLALVAKNSGGGNSSNNNNNNNNNNGNNNNTPSKPIVDVINQLLTKYDTNHDGKFEKDELDRMAALEPDKATQARLFDMDKNGTVDLEEIAKWRLFLKTSTPAK